MSDKPVISDDPMYLLLRDGEVEEFNSRRPPGQPLDLSGCDFSGMDLRGMDANGLNLADASFHQGDLRGIDLRHANLLGASIHGARIAGAYFPTALDAAEISLSLEHGTRMRYRG